MSSSWQLVIKDLQGHQINVEICNPQTATVHDVKRLISQQDSNMPVFEQRLVYNKEEMQDDRLLSSYPDMKNGSHIALIRLIPFQLFVKGMDGSSYTFRIPSRTPETFLVSSFKRLVQERTSLRPEEQRLQYGGKELVDRQRLGDYNIPNNGTLHLVSRLRGGAWNSRMPCGHAVPSTGLYQHCMAAVRGGSDCVLCPVCSAEWTTKTLKGRVELSESQFRSVEEGLTRNFCLRMPGVITCKGCGSVWSRGTSSAGGGDLCSSCAVKQHDGKKATVELLAACPNKTIDHAQDCPTLRACPKCGNVIEHEINCRRVDCNRCQTTFCFICLTIRSPSCSTYYPCPDRCATARRQLIIPQH